MDAFIDIFGKITLTDVILLVVALVFLYKVGSKIVAWISGVHDRKKEECEKIESLASNIENVNGQLKNIQADLSETKKNIFELKVNFGRDIKRIEDENNNYRVASLRDNIFKDYQAYIKQGFVSEAQLNNFDTNIKEYTKRGGNSAVIDKYKPEVFALPVADKGDFVLRGE